MVELDIPCMRILFTAPLGAYPAFFWKKGNYRSRYVFPVAVME
jgi:hypothetical protein